MAKGRPRKSKKTSDKMVEIEDLEISKTEEQVSEQPAKATPFDLGGVNFTDPEGNTHNLPILGYHVAKPNQGYLLVIGSESTEKYISSKDFTILKFEESNIMSISTEEEYREVAEIFRKELSRQSNRAEVSN